MTPPETGNTFPRLNATNLDSPPAATPADHLPRGVRLETGTFNEYTLLNIFADGGGWMYPLLLASMVAVGVIIAKGYMLWVAGRKSRTLLEETERLVKAGKIREAVNLNAETEGPVAAILLTALRRVEGKMTDTSDVEHALRTTGTIELGFLERGLVVLATVSNVAPLLGFLGTVAGMIAAFGAIEIAGQVEASLVAGGIKVALITTATGLVIAIPVNIAYNFYVARIDRLIVDMERGSAKVLNLIWDMTPGMTPAVAGAGAGGRTGTPPRQVDEPVEGRDNYDPGSSTLRKDNQP